MPRRIELEEYKELEEKYEQALLEIDLLKTEVACHAAERRADKEEVQRMLDEKNRAVVRLEETSIRYQKLFDRCNAIENQKLDVCAEMIGKLEKERDDREQQVWDLEARLDEMINVYDDIDLYDKNTQRLFAGLRRNSYYVVKLKTLNELQEAEEKYGDKLLNNHSV